jgi:hypothetical protein
MTHQTDHKSIEDLLVSNTLQLDALFRLLLDKGLFSEDEFQEKLMEVQLDYQNKSGDAE